MVIQAIIQYGTLPYLEIITGKQDLLPLPTVGHVAVVLAVMSAVGHTAVTHHRHCPHTTGTLTRHLQQ